MREILFRGFNKENGCWFYGLLGKFDGKHYIITEGGVKPFVDSESVGQYTGFNDNNDKMIFEGGILRIEQEYNGEMCICHYEVYFAKTEGIWAAYDEFSGDDVELYILLKNKNEILRNIYEENAEFGLLDGCSSNQAIDNMKKVAEIIKSQGVKNW